MVCYNALLVLKILILYLSGLCPMPMFGSVLYWVLALDLDSRMVMIWSDGLHRMLSHGNCRVLGELMNTGH